MPYFSFTSERGSTCTNNFTGYTCTPLTLAEVEYYGEFDLPDDTTVISGTLPLDPRLPAGGRARGAPRLGAAALKSLNEQLRPLCEGQPSPLDTAG